MDKNIDDKKYSIHFRTSDDDTLRAFPTHSSEPEAKARSITYGRLALIAISALVGGLSSLYVFNLESDSIRFTATELISFTLSVFLSSASIILAVSAISLGRSSEDAIMRRSDDSIRMQNEVFTKTTQALSQIQSSTGVTEKRIEDMIAGRAGDISQSIMEQFQGDKRNGDFDYQQMEEKLRNTIIETFESQNNRPKTTVVDHEASKERRLRRQALQKKYDAGHNKLFSMYINSEKPEIVKLPNHGFPGKKGEDAVDAVFKIGGKRLAVSTFSPYTPHDMGMLVLSGVELLNSDLADRLIYIFFADEEEEEYRELTSRYSNLINQDVAGRMKFFSIGYDHLEKAVEAIKNFS